MDFEQKLSAEDPDIYQAIQNELKRQQEQIELIASENIVSKAVLEAQGSILTNKYAEGYSAKRYYGGCEFIDVVENLAIDRAKKLFNAQFVNVQPHSGSQANTAVYVALLQPNDTIMGMSLDAGGHLTHGAKVSFSGKWLNAVGYGVSKDTGLIDYDQVERLAIENKPKLIIAGGSAYPRQVDFARFREICNRVGAYLMVDMAHFAGLVAGGVHPNPLEFADVVTTTTHKTLRGPRGGMILTNNPEIAKKINSAIFPGTQGGPLMHIIAGKAVGFGENLKPEWNVYAKQVKSNIKAMADVLVNRGFDLVSGGTDNHLILMSFLNRDFSGKDADAALGNAGITVNKNTVPGETRSPFVTSGIRIGSPALTARGMKEAEFIWIANKIADILDNITDTKLQKDIEAEIFDLGARFPVYDKPIF